VTGVQTCALPIYFEQLILPDEIHGFLRHQSWLRAYHAEADFFGRKL
jgi:dipeptidyl aminopeptidase/acylaminoacyl peptidase